MGFSLNPGGQVVSQSRCNMANFTKRRHCIRYFGNHLDTMFLLIASMVSVTHNRRRISIKVVIVKKIIQKRRKIHLLIVSNRKPDFWEEQQCRSCILFSAVFAAAVFQVNMSHSLTKLRKKSDTLKTTGFVMPGRQYHNGQDQGGSSWILENNFLQAFLHLGKKTSPNSNPNLKDQEQIKTTSLSSKPPYAWQTRLLGSATAPKMPLFSASFAGVVFQVMVSGSSSSTESR